VVRRLQCLLWRRGHQWVETTWEAIPFGIIEYTYECAHCNKRRKELVMEH